VLLCLTAVASIALSRRFTSRNIAQFAHKLWTDFTVAKFAHEVATPVPSLHYTFRLYYDRICARARIFVKTREAMLMMYLQAFGGTVALLVILLISAPMRSAFFKTNLKKDIKFILKYG